MSSSSSSSSAPSNRDSSRDGTPMEFEKSFCGEMRLWHFEHLYVFKPLDPGFSQLLSISKRSGELQLISELPINDSQKSVKSQIVYGFLGVLQLLSEVYPLVVTSREFVGTYHRSPVFKILSMKFLHCYSTLRNLSQEQKEDEAHLRSLLDSVEKTSGLYMSYTVDLTHSLQNSFRNKKCQPSWRQGNRRFVWNQKLLESAADMQVDSFLLPVIQGSFDTFKLELQQAPVKLSIIARRCTHRIGTRMWRRGASRDGDAANFVETEQLLEVNGHLASYVQVRGSIPLLWQQIVDLKYKPKIELANSEESLKVLERHFQDLAKRYGSVVAIDLVNKHGGEAILGKAYANAMQNILSEKIRYFAFDFHHICGQVNFEQLANLYEQVKEELNKQSYFLIQDSGVLIEEQKGIVRTNCIDCLDRTNVTQSLFGRKLLEAQLRRLHILGESEKISQYLEFDTRFKELWADHGDNISIQYAGTSALKGDFVRHGKRTISGVLQDGYSALARYYYNNLHDGKRQDALDLVAGHYAVGSGFSFREDRIGRKFFTYLPIVSWVIFTAVLFTVMFLREASQNAYQMLYVVIWGSVTLSIVSFVRSNGRRFTSRPRLCKMQ